MNFAFGFTGVAVSILVVLLVPSSFLETADESTGVIEILIESDSSYTDSVSIGCCVGSSDCAAALQSLPPLPGELESLEETK